MKNFSILTIFIITYSINGFSQNQIVTDSMPFTFEQQIATVFEHVDLSEVTNGNGLLYEHGMPLFTIEPFNGILTDSSKSSMLNFSLLYATLYSMAIENADRLPHPDAYRNICDSIRPESDIIPVTFLHQELYRLSEEAITNNQMTSTNNQLYDVVGRTTSPYYLDEVFNMTPAVSNVKGSTLKLQVNSNLIFNNTGKIIQSIEIDMADGRGYQKADVGQVATATYDSTKTVTVKFKTTYTDASTYYAHSDILVEVPENETESTSIFPYDTYDELVHLYATESYLGGVAGGKVYVSLACGHTAIQKPFIWAEGYNAAYGSITSLQLGFDDAVSRLNFDIEISPGNLVSLSEYLEEEGYDLIVLDYDDGGDYLPRTAMFIEEAIRWVNKRKHEAGSSEKNVIIGQSMGGMCSKLALRKMEVNGEDHEVGTYISFDSGLQGVNLPLGVLNLFRHVSEINVFGLIPISSFVQIIDDAIGLADKPASRTMPFYQPNTVFNLNSSYYSLQNDVYGMPQNCEVLAIANGSKLGVSGGQNFNSGDYLLKSKENTINLINSWSGWGQSITSTAAIVAGSWLA